MFQKPKHYGTQYAATFHDIGVVDSYPNRPPYPDNVFEILEGLLSGLPRSVLDIGCGTGDIARRIVDSVERVDAVDFSQAMIEKGRNLDNGNNAKLNWIHGRTEEALLNPPYGLVAAGESILWMDWEVLIPLPVKLVSLIFLCVMILMLTIFLCRL